MSVLHYFARNSFIRLAAYAVAVVAVFLVTPHILRCLGTDAYGAWGLISGLASYYLLLDFGLLNAVSKYAAAAEATHDAARLQAVFSTALALGCVGFLLVAAAAVVLSLVSDRFAPEHLDLSAFGVSLIIFSLSIALQLMLRSAHGLLAGAMRWTALALLNMLRLVLTSTAVLLILSPAHGPAQNMLYLAGINAAGNAFEALVKLAAVRFSLGVRFSLSGVSMAESVQLLRFGLKSFVTQAGDLLRNRTQIYVIATILSVSQVAFYSLARQFINYMQDIIFAIFGIMNPYFSRLQAVGDTEGYRQPLLDSLRLCYALSSLISLGLIFYGDLFVLRWLGPGYETVQAVLVPSALAGMLAYGETPGSGFLIGLGQHAVLAKYSLLQGLLITILSVPAAWLGGLVAVAWILPCTALLFSLGLMPLRISRIAGLPVKRYYGNLCLSLVPQCLGQSLFYLLVRNLLRPDYLSIALAAAGQSLVALLILIATLKRTASRTAPA